MRRFIRLVLGAMGVILAATALMLTVREAEVENTYRKLGEQVTKESTGGTESSCDWKEMLAQNGDAVAWITVDQTPIDYPVVQPDASVPDDYYLSHNFWRQADMAGCPYLDVRSQITGDHMMVFGHRLGSTDRMFGSLNQAWRKEAFEAVGDAHLESPCGAFEFSPLCALKVDRDFTDIQRFAFQNDEEMRAWLSGIMQQASARCADPKSLIAQAQRVLTLVTCASMQSGGRERTLVVFVSSA